MHNLPELLNQGILTGSRAFNVATEESDWDIVINMSEYKLVIMELEKLDIDYTEHHVETDKVDEAPSRSENPYDPTIWGPIEYITKYKDDNGNYINLFVYHNTIYPNVKELFSKLNFLIHGYTDLDDKEIRIEAFIDLIEQLAPDYWLAEHQ